MTGAAALTASVRSITSHAPYLTGALVQPRAEIGPTGTRHLQVGWPEALARADTHSVMETSKRGAIPPAMVRLGSGDALRSLHGPWPIPAGSAGPATCQHLAALSARP